MSDVPRIFVTAFPADNGRYIGFALAEDGEGLASQYCLNVVWVRHAMGINSRWCRQKYRAKYPDGYRLIDLTEATDKQLKKNKDYMRALALNEESPTP